VNPVYLQFKRSKEFNPPTVKTYFGQAAPNFRSKP